MDPESNLSSSPESVSSPIESSISDSFIETQRVERTQVEAVEQFEQYEQRSESASTQPAQTVDPTPAPVAPPSQSSDAPVAISDTSNPATAKDGDLIEREWVQKAKQILSETNEDPHARNERIQALQADYLSKRYNRKLGDGD